MNGSDEALGYRHFELHELAEGVWAAVHRAGGWMVANCGIVDLGGSSLVFDTGLTPEGGFELRRACERLTGSPPACVLNSHYHNDHVRGNEAFPDAEVVSGRRTRELLDTRGRQELAEDARVASERLAVFERMRDDPDPIKRRAALTYVPYWQALEATAPRVELRPADAPVARERAFEGDLRRAVFTVMGPAHTEEDAVLRLPEDGVVFCGDLLFVASHPYLAHGDPDAWRAVLADLAGLGATSYVPGHGPVGGPEDLGRLRAYIDDVEEAARLELDSGATGGGPAAMPEAYRAWDLAYPFYEVNVRFMGERMAVSGGAR